MRSLMCVSIVVLVLCSDLGASLSKFGVLKSFGSLSNWPLF